MSHEFLDMVVFSAAGWRIGIEAGRVRDAHPAPAEQRTERNAIEVLLGPVAVTNPPAERRQCLSLKRQAIDQKMMVDGPVELLSLPVASIHPLPPLLAARTQLPGLRALALHSAPDGQKLSLLFDADALS